MKTISLAVLLLIGEIDATYVVGKCPQIKYDWKATHPGKDLEPARLEGLWSNVWESYTRLQHSDCMHMKLHQLDANNSTRFQMFNGVSWKEDDEIIYDDHTVLVFNHPSDSSLAAVTTPEDIDGNLDHTYLSEFESVTLPELEDSVKEHMDVMDIFRYEQKQREINAMKDHMHHAMTNYDRYAHPMQVVDTDYSDYLVLYKCRDEERKMNQDHDDFVTD
jgi:hypothetical protein